MADTTALKNRIRAAIKANDNQEITGPVLQQTLLDIVDELDLNPELEDEITARQQGDTELSNLITGIKNNIDNRYVYAGIAMPSTVPVSGKVFYVATQAGTYTNFNGIAVTEGITILKYDGSTWIREQILSIDDEPIAGSENLVKSGGVADAIATAKSDIPLVDEDGFYIIDEDHNVGMKYDEDGLDAAKVSSHLIEVLKAAGISADEVMASYAAEVNEDGFFIADESLNVGVKVDSDGIHAKNILEYEIIEN